MENMNMPYFTHAKDPIGVFTECEVGYDHEFSSNPDTHLVFAKDFDHIIWTRCAMGYRYANVKKTVVEICIDEDESGKPIVQKWRIRNRKSYLNTIPQA